MIGIEADPKTIEVSGDPLLFCLANIDNRRLRMWIFREIHGPETAMSQATIDYMELAFQWIKKGKPKPKIRVVK